MLTSRQHRDPEGRDDGYSLTELLVAMLIFGMLMSMTFTLLIQVLYQSRDTTARTRTLQEAKLGISQIDRQVRSGNVILDPGSETMATAGVPPFFSMRIHTQVDEENKCAQWRVIDSDGDSFGDLEFRTWPTGNPSLAEPWSAVAHNLVKMDVAPASELDIERDDPLTWPPFWVDSDATGGTEAQLVRVTLRLKDPDEREGSKATSITTVITGRNTVFGYPASSCAVAPPP